MTPLAVFAFAVTCGPECAGAAKSSSPSQELEVSRHVIPKSSTTYDAPTRRRS